MTKAPQMPLRRDVLVAWRYDDAGRRVEAAFYGADGAPVSPVSKRPAEA